MLIESVAEPAPDDLPTLSHAAPGVAVHGQVATGVVIDAVTVVPAMHGLRTTGETEYWHKPTSPDCRTVKRRSPTVMAAVRSGMSARRETAYDTVLVPVPRPPPVLPALPKG
jgi:hypothetical protein